MEIELPTDAEVRAVLAMRKFLYLPLITAVSLVVLVSLVIIPNIRKILDVRKDIAVARGELTALETKSNLLENIDEESIEEKLVVLERVLPSNKDVYALLVALTGLAAEKGVSLMKFEVSPGSIATESATASAQPEVEQLGPRRTPLTSREDLETLAATLDVQGSFPQVRDFLIEAQRISPLIRLSMVKLAPFERQRLEATASGIEVTVGLMLDLFYGRLPRTIGALGAPLPLITESEEALYEELVGYRAFETEIPSDLVVGKEDLFSSL